MADMPDPIEVRVPQSDWEEKTESGKPVRVRCKACRSINVYALATIEWYEVLQRWCLGVRDGTRVHCRFCKAHGDALYDEDEVLVVVPHLSVSVDLLERMFKFEGAAFDEVKALLEKERA